MRFGPVPLVSGLHLEPPKARAGGLIDCLNFEERDGYLASRRGSRALGRCRVLDANNVNGVSLGDASGTNGAAFYVGLDDVEDLDVGEWVTIQLTAGTPETTEEDWACYFWGVDDDWHLLITGRPWNKTQVTFPSEGPIAFMVPDGWEKGTPSGSNSDAYEQLLPGTHSWLKFVRTSSWTFASLNPNAESQDLEAIALMSFRARGGPVGLAAVWPDTTSSADEYLRFYNYKGPMVEATGAFLPAVSMFNGTKSVQTILAATKNPDDFQWLYIPASDALIAYTGSGWLRIWPDYLFDEGPALDRGYNCDILEPDSVAENTDYEDIILESAFPVPEAIGLYQNRLFFAEKGTGLIRWTAPGEFWTVLPSSNQYLLAARGAGKTQAMAEFQGSLYLFREDSIWRAFTIDPIPGQESNLAFQMVNGTGCTSKRSVQVTEDGIIFLSPDGLRLFNGQSAQLISQPVRALFDPDSEHAFAVRRPWTARGVWDPIEQVYRLYYSTAGARENDACLSVSARDGSCWLAGSDYISAVGVPGEAAEKSPIGGTVSWGPRATDAVWDHDAKRIITMNRRGYVEEQGRGHRDMGVAPIAARAETHAVQGLGRMKDTVLTEFHAVIDRFAGGSVKVSAVADGRRVDSRTVEAERFGAGGDELGEESTTEMELTGELRPHTPVIWRGMQRGRSHRVRIETVAPAHVPLRVSALTGELSE